MRVRLTIILLLGLATATQAQTTPPVVEVRDLRTVPRDIADEVQQIFNAPEARRVSGDLTIPASDVVTGDVAVMNGQVTIAGQVTGRVAVINGSLVVRGAGRVGGSAIVIGGTA